MIVLTAELIESLKTPAGGWNRATMDAIAVPWPLRAGWIQSTIGRTVSDRDWAAAEKASQQARHYFRGNTRRYGAKAYPL